MHAFTMMPPDVVGKKKPLGYESDEPTSPEVTCIGKVRRKHCKATWDALVKEKNKDAKKKGKVKRLSGEIPHNSDFFACGNKREGGESTVAAKMSRQASERRRSLDFEGFPTDSNMHTPRHGDSAKEVLIQDTQQKSSSFQGERVKCEHEDFEASVYDRIESAAPALLSGIPPPSNCLLLMKKGSRNRSAHYEQLVQEPGHASNQWNWGQVLT